MSTLVVTDEIVPARITSLQLVGSEDSWFSSKIEEGSPHYIADTGYVSGHEIITNG
ncbi:hypothetical protein Osc7112_3919 [Oscillatoria nigro-viridis PCC 7112]|uniref:Uncharacterized protein n=1 Tax=Phormidium nigroviride PCC 7112 TaxID=179408 RepID=K9VJX6_9CYAN|nr:hypothetical protein [Oscillatoria nigro-viridis]AFZ08256.1 hypothetical protein Osc7112_3919 [Oscillatoria nigro-viridis PCC 7112]